MTDSRSKDSEIKKDLPWGTMISVSLLTVVHLLLAVFASPHLAILWIEIPLLVILVFLWKKSFIGLNPVLCFSTVVIYQAGDPSVFLPGVFWLVLVPSFFLIQREKSKWKLFLWGLWMGFMLSSGIYTWLVIAFQNFFDASILTAAFFLCVSSIVIGFHFAVFLPLCSWLKEHVSVPIGILMAVLFAVIEYWNPVLLPVDLSLGLYRDPPAMQLADMIGATGLALIVGLVSGGIGYLILGIIEKNQKEKRFGILGTVSLLIVVYGYGLIQLIIQNPDENDHAISIGIIQPMAPLKVLSEDQQVRQETSLKLREISEQLINESEPKPQFIVWPEGSGAFSSSVPNYNPEYMQQLQIFLREYQTPVLVQDIELFRDENQKVKYYANATLLDPLANEIQSHRKIKLLPFAEYMPMDDAFPFLRDIFPGVRNVLAGQEPVILEGEGYKILPMICFENLFGDYLRQYAYNSDVIVELTNNRWFGDRQQPWQHQSFAAYRAIENRRPVARATNSGISCLIDSRGMMIDGKVTNTGEEAILFGEVRTSTQRTLYSRFGDFLPRFLLPMCLFLFVTAELISRRRKNTVNTEDKAV